MTNPKEINIHLISDSTGETLSSVSRAVMSQFEGAEAKEFIWPLVRTTNHIDKIIDSIKSNPGIILYTILKDEIIEKLRQYCNKMNLLCISAISPVVVAFAQHLNMPVTKAVGRQHILDQEYFSKVEAINYTINHDDGQLGWDLDDADVVIIGVSRASKSPTSIYLSCRGYKVGNIPFVSIETMPEQIFSLTKPMIVGLTINPEKLVQIRQNRLKSIGGNTENDYIDIEIVKKEITESRKLYNKLKCHVIDVTRKSVEETAAQIINLLQDRRLQK